MAESQTMSKSEVLAELAALSYLLSHEDEAYLARLDAIAAAVRGWCIRTHCYQAESLYTGETLGDGTA